jgi:hypothetical protein
MASFVTPIAGQSAVAESVAQITEDLSGLRNIPLSVTGINDAASYALALKNVGAGAKGLIIYAADGATILLQVDAAGAKASADGTTPASTVATANSVAAAIAAIPTGLTNASITNAKLAADVARANQLVNGGHDIWQRGVGPFTATAAYAADRHQITLVGTDTLSVSRNTANVDLGSVACSACTFVLGSGAGATRYSQVLKTTDGYQLAGRTIAFSARRRTATAAAVRIGILTDGTGGTTTYSGFHTGGGTYETLTATVTVPTDATTITISTYFAASCTAYCDNDNLTFGAVAADYVPLQPADDLARCLRYYEIFGDNGGFIVSGYNAAASAIFQSTSFKARKAVAPTVTKVGTWGVLNSPQPSVDISQADVFRMTLTPTGTGYGYATSTAGSAYVTAEANP